MGGVRAARGGGERARVLFVCAASQGVQTVIPYRGDDMEWRHLRVSGDLGMVVPRTFHPEDEDSIRRAIAGSDAVINLIGKDHETRHYVPWLVNQSFESTHVDTAARIARLCVEQGVSTLVHVSALAADKYSLSRWARAKALGEEAVRAEAPGATIVRPADMFGPEDRFLNAYARMHQLLPRVPLVEGGVARVQPLFVHDFARALHAIVRSEDPDVMLGQTYDLAGPEVYTHREVVEYVFEQIQAEAPEVFNVSAAVAEAVGSALGVLPYPLVHADRFRRWQEDNVLDDARDSKRLHHLGLQATSMEMPGFSWLHTFRTGSSIFEDLHAMQRQQRDA
jgi:NADH dehydrogenase (ubiquinone) 1 alpha subcomplex subunit 9